MNYDYCGERIPDGVPTALCEGWRDRWRHPHERTFYRRPWWKRVLWKIGNLAARMR